MMRRLVVSIMLVILVAGFSLPTAAQNRRRLANGYMLEPAGTGVAAELARFFKGFVRLRKTGSGCIAEEINYEAVGAEDKYFQWVVKKADRDGNSNGMAELAELQAMWNTACENRGE